jgi:multiple sugar transport system permease protein
MSRTKAQQAWIYVGVSAVMLFTLGPLVLLVIATFSSQADLTAKTLHLIPDQWTLKNYANVFSGEANDGSVPPFLTAMRNSGYISVITTLVCLAVGIPAGYAYARFRFRGKDPFLISVLGFRMVPEIVLLIPLYVIFARANMINNKETLVIIYAAFNLPLVIWLLQSFFRSIPKSMEESAYMDGVSGIGFLIRFVIPLSAPGLIATSAFVLLATWDEFMFASIFTSTYDAKTIPVAISEFSKRGMVDFGMQITGGFLASLPPIIAALFLQKYIISGLSEGSEKG